MAHNTRTHTRTISPFFVFLRNQAHLRLVVDPLVLDPLEHQVVVLQDLVDLLHPLVDLPDLVDPLVLRVPLGHQGHLALLDPLGLLDHPRKKKGWQGITHTSPKFLVVLVICCFCWKIIGKEFFKKKNSGAKRASSDWAGGSACTVPPLLDPSGV